MLAALRFIYGNPEVSWDIPVIYGSPLLDSHSMDSESSEDKNLSTRVNAARLQEYIGRHVRLACKVLKMNENRATVQASDGGQVNVQLTPKSQTASMDLYVELVVRVTDPTTVQMLTYLNLGNDLDMELVNDTIELIHDPRFYEKMFC